MYVGKTIQADPKTRLNQHIKLLNEGRHHTDRLQENWNLTKKYKHSIIKKGQSFFKVKIALIEQRCIDRYSNCNESRAIGDTRYSRKELCYDIVDLTAKYHKFLIVMLLLLTAYVYSNFV